MPTAIQTAVPARNEPDGAEGEHCRRDDGRQRNRELSPGDRAQLRDVETPACLEALAEAMRVDVRNPEDEHGHDDDRREVPEIVLEGLPAGRERRKNDDRPVDRSRNAPAGAEDKSPESLSTAHARIMRQGLGNSQRERMRAPCS